MLKSKALSITFLGHAALLFEAPCGKKLLTDPYESGGFSGKMAYPPIDIVADYVVCSHQHADHCAVHTLKGNPEEIISGTKGPFHIERHTLAHDEYGGRKKGGLDDMLIITVDQHWVIIHASDIGQSPEPLSCQKLPIPDILCIPVGGFFTIGAAQAWEWQRRLSAKFVIPIHAKTNACGLPIRSADIYKAYTDHTHRAPSWVTASGDCQWRVDRCH